MVGWARVAASGTGVHSVGVVGNGSIWRTIGFLASCPLIVCVWLWYAHDLPDRFRRLREGDMHEQIHTWQKLGAVLLQLVLGMFWIIGVAVDTVHGSR